MLFLDQRISIDYLYGCSWFDDFAVKNITVDGGAEYASLLHPYPIRHITVSYQQNLPKVYTDIYNIYFRVFKSLAGFRARCADDFSTAADGKSPAAHTDQSLIQISSTVYQLVKEYGTDQAGLPTIGRPKRLLLKPVLGTVKIGVGGVLQSSGFTVDHNTGRVTFVSAPGAAVTGGCEFDIPVRFESPLQINQNHFTSRSLPDIDLIELLNP